jgi:hypothetical protein
VNILPLLIQLVSGAACGNLVSAAFNKISLGPIMSSLAGMLGGEIGGRFLLSLTGGGAAGDTSDVEIFVASLLGGAMGGAVFSALAGGIKGMLRKRF